MKLSSPSTTRPFLVTAALLAGLLFSACGDDDASSSGSSGLEVSATTAVAAEMAAKVGGERANVTQLVPDNASPHTYAPSAKEQAELEGADLLVQIDPLLEEALPVEAAERRFAIGDHVGGLREFGEGEVAEDHGEGDHGEEGDDHGHDEGEKAHEEDGEAHEEGEEHEGESGHEEGEEHEHGAGSLDPHLWLDPTRLAVAAPDLADQFAELDPDGAAEYRANARAYAAELEELDAELEAMVETIPEGQRKLVTSHDSMGYFADRYGFEVTGTLFGAAPDAEAGARSTQELIEEIESAGVPAVFAQAGDDAELLRAVASDAGVEVVDGLLISGFSDEAPDYASMMRFTTERITAALSQ